MDKGGSGNQDVIVKDGVLTLYANSYDYQFIYNDVKSTTGDNAWTETTLTSGTADRLGQTKFTDKFEGINLGKSSSNSITLRFKGVSSADLYIMDTNRGRTFLINGETYKTCTTSGENYKAANSCTPEGDTKGKEWIYTLSFDDTDSVTTLIIAGGDNAVYPLGIVLKK